MQQVLKQIQLFDLFRYRKRIIATFKNVRHWRYATGHCVDGEKYESILGAFEGQVADALLDRLFRGITEAMTNCHHHAYILPRQDGLSVQPAMKDWWMFSQENDGYLSVVFCDLGVGIPTTLPVKRPGLWKRITGRGQVGDGEVIKQALEDSKTRTGKSYRGKGLKQLLEAAQMFEGGSLRIYSNGGCYTYERGQEKVREFGNSILGTLIQWKVPIVQSNLQL